MPVDDVLADELVNTVRDWVRKDVIPNASEYEHADRYPEPMVEQMKAFGIFGGVSLRSTAGSRSTCSRTHG